MPAGQGAHSVPLVYVPAGHGTEPPPDASHFVAPAGAVEPAAQAMHAASDVCEVNEL